MSAAAARCASAWAGCGATVHSAPAALVAALAAAVDGAAGGADVATASLLALRDLVTAAADRGDDVGPLGAYELLLRPVAGPNSNLQLDFNVSVRDSFDATSLASLRELDESNRFVQKSAESTSI